MPQKSCFLIVLIRKTQVEAILGNTIDLLGTLLHNLQFFALTHANFCLECQICFINTMALVCQK